jgi:GDPmannose 4,6-dehydratase
LKSALVTGITGQDGSYLAELLLSKGYVVHGIVRRSSSFNTGRIDAFRPEEHDPDARFFLHYGDLADASALRRVVEAVRPDEVYNLGAQSHVRISFDEPEYTADIVAMGTLRLLEAVRGYAQSASTSVKFYQAGSSEMFGGAAAPQDEHTPFYPRSPYAVAKVAAHGFAVNYRESFGMFIANGILFNHESPRRGENFVTRKITTAVGRIRLGSRETLYLGNLKARRDWGFAGDYVDAMWRMLQHDSADDFVIGTGESHTVEEFLDEAFGYADLDWHDHVKIEPRLFRPTEVDALEGDASKARRVLGWSPRVTFRDLVRLMVDSDTERARQQMAATQALTTTG